jgi:hypothetical protein
VGGFLRGPVYHPFARVGLGLSRLGWGRGFFFLPLAFLVRLSGLWGYALMVFGVAAMGRVDARERGRGRGEFGESRSRV